MGTAYMTVHCAALGHGIVLIRTGLISNRNVNRLEFRKLRAAPGCDTGPHVRTTTRCAVIDKVM